jgi:hypothetical protein
MAERRISLLRDLERALLEAISESAEVHRSLERMRDEGYTLQIFLDCQRADTAADSNLGVRAPETLEPARVPAALPVPAAARAGSERRPRSTRKAPPAAPAPLFRINSEDLAMLRALGIDPTRKGRARR